jgi:hypothetical protein
MIIGTLLFGLIASNEALSEDPMSTEPALEVISVERIDGTEIVVEFSDLTYATYTTQRLLDMATNRRPAETNGNDWNVPM